MKKSILLLILLGATVLSSLVLTSCKDDGIEISDSNKSRVPKNVELLEYGPTSLTICWDFIRGATSYTVQLVDKDMLPISESTCMTTADIDYHEFTNLSPSNAYYGRVRANFPYSSTSDWVYVAREDRPQMLMAGIGALDINPDLKLHNATNSTLTYEWSFAGDPVIDASRVYNIELFKDAECKELYVSWIADGVLSGGKGLFTTLADYNVVRFTFSGLNAETKYYARVTNKSFADIQTPVVEGITAKAGVTASKESPAKVNDVVMAQDFSLYIHGGDIVRSAAAYNVPTALRAGYSKATGENPIADGMAPCNWSAEFNVFDGGGVSAEYTKAVGMEGWGKSGNTSTRPGYIKIGGSKAEGALYTPQLSTLPTGSTVKVEFSAAVYAESQAIYGKDILVQAVEGAKFSATGAVSTAGVVVASQVVDISQSNGEFGKYSAVLEGLSPTARVCFASNPAGKADNLTRFLLDDIVVTYAGQTQYEVLATPQNVKFDAEAVFSDKLTLTWDAVAGAVTYTVLYYKDGTDPSAGSVITGVETTSRVLTDLDPKTTYHATVKACRVSNSEYDSPYATAITQKTADKPQTAGLLVSKIASSSSTVTVEWARKDAQALSNSSQYSLCIYSDAACKSLVQGWSSVSGVFSITAGVKFRYTFSGLNPATTYYVVVKDVTNDVFADPFACETTSRVATVTAAATGSAVAGSVILVEEFAKFVHGGDIANFAASYSATTTNRATYSPAVGLDATTGNSFSSPTQGEFDVFSGGSVATAYTEGTGLIEWCKSGNIATRPGYAKLGAGGASATLYTPELKALRSASKVVVRFSAQAYSEKFDGSSADVGKVQIKAVRGVTVGDKNAAGGTIVDVAVADLIDISSAMAMFKEFSVTLDNVTPDCRIMIATTEKRMLLDNVVIVCESVK